MRRERVENMNTDPGGSVFSIKLEMEFLAETEGRGNRTLEEMGYNSYLEESE